MFKYRLTQKKDNLKTQKVFYHATSIKQGEVKDDDLLDQLSSRTKLHRIDCQRLLLHLSELLANSLLESKSVTLPELGTFRCTMSSKGVEDPKKFKMSDITGLNIKFLPHKKLKAKMDKVVLKRIK